MLRTAITIAPTISNKSANILSTLPSPVSVQTVRWARKPRWLPTAKSKIFRIPVKPKIPVEEKIEIQRLYNIYKTQMRSIRAHLRSITGVNTMEIDGAAKDAVTEEDFVRCAQINDEWNAEIAKLREIRLEKEREQTTKHILKRLLKKEEEEAAALLKAEEHVKRLKEESVTFITPQNIDQAIEEAMNNIVDYNYAIDSDGTQYRGKYIKPEEAEPEGRKRAQQNN